MEFTFDAPLWRWQGDAAWHFIALPEDVADEIEDSPTARGGFGSVRVESGQVGATSWSTSVFPDKIAAPSSCPSRSRYGTVRTWSRATSWIRFTLDEP